jgi:2-haloacid dehalogenase
MDHRIRVVVFDAYGTLFDTHSVAPVCEEAFPEWGMKLSQLWRAKQLEYTWLRSLMEHYEDFWHVTESALAFACQTLGLRCDAPTRCRLMGAYLSLDLYPDVREALGTLTAYPLAILSNGTPSMLQSVVQSAGISKAFLDLISVDEIKIYKPSPRVYKLATEKLATELSAIGFVSSNSWDVIGAQAYGFWTCWLNRSGTHPDELGFPPNQTTRTLTGLPDALSAT